MGKRRRYIEPFETEIESLGPRGVGLGTAPDGRTVAVRGAPPGSRIFVQPAGLRKGRWNGRRKAMIRPPADYAPPACPQFGLCGGCTLQELSLDGQAREKHAMALRDVHAARGEGTPFTAHPTRHAGAAYAYRNKVELSFGPTRYLSEADHERNLPLDGKFLGFHAPGRFDRVVDTPHCALISEPMNALLQTTREVALAASAPAPWDQRAHEGFLRHLVLREGQQTGELLVVVHTSRVDHQPFMEQLAEALMATALPSTHRVVGVVWRVHEGVSDVATGPIEQVWGTPSLQERLGPITYTLSPDTFFQTNTPGALVLYDTIAAALPETTATLVDLYCGVGAIGLYLADRCERLWGFEVVERAIVNARETAEAHGITHATFEAGKVEACLDQIAALPGPRAIIVDPPRAGLHPSVARMLAQASGEVLIYVACKPGSLGRDAAILESGRWQLESTWTVDLFPQTGHVEMVARFIPRQPATS